MGSTSDGITTYIVPDVSIKWILQYNCTSNVDLATLSNVNRRWRHMTLKYIQDVLKSVIEEEQEQEQEQKEEQESSGVMSYPILGLLLPDMAVEIAKRRLVSMNFTTSFLSRQSSAFCLAWFSPGGIRLRTIDLSENLADDNDNDYSSSSTCDIATRLKQLRQATHRLKSNRSMTKMTKKSSNLQTVTDEWQGYQNATDVLKPFGYATAFVNDVLHYSAEYIFDTKSMVKREPFAHPINVMLAELNNVSKLRRTTFAVRGTTFARPHGYCLCWENAQTDTQTRLIKLQGELLVAKNAHEQMALMQQIGVLERREKKTLLRMRDSLPCTVKSTLAKNPNFQRPFGQLEGRRQRCVQFLNADRERAVYMRTHPFDCGPIGGPMTVFLVGIATEDGCFVSGLKKRFEIGHMSYGIGSSDSLVDMSPICIAVDTLAKDEVQSMIGAFQGSNHSSKLLDGDSDDSSAFEQSHKEVVVGDMHCDCKIQWQQQYDNDSYDEDDNESVQSEVKENRVVRGALGPGRWHIYTVIFDGSNSTIRVDGIEEPTSSSKPASIEGEDTPKLDGITIGSDHLFDMSLCFGEGSEGEGSGSIAELAYFKGDMDLHDIACVENHLMKKHGVIHGSSLGVGSELSIDEANRTDGLGKVGDQWQEDQWVRDVHSLMVHSPPFATSSSGGGVPLRVAARHRAVAWHRCCEVTGKPIRVSRIGSKLSTGDSSDL